MSARAKCVLILSHKCSGSSACQNLLSKFARINTISRTRHFQNETLYWTKAASLLGMHQQKMLDSEVPLSRRRAKADIVTLLRDNLWRYQPAADDRELVFGGWRRLCQKYAPVFLEKSPHHLFQQSALRLITQCMETLDDVDFLLIGLVRNPMDTLYSAFTRWRIPPEQYQYEWLTAYRNLRQLADLAGSKLVVVRYEDMVRSCEPLRPVLDFCGARIKEADQTYLHTRSLAKWKHDKLYGFRLADEVAELALTYGYEPAALANRGYRLWPAYRDMSRSLYKSLRLGAQVVRGIGKRAA